jgi:nucleotide-binding universal stress UspA family protein
MYANILIPTASSKLASKAVQHGIALAKRIGAKVTVLTVAPMPRKLSAPPPQQRNQEASNATRSRSGLTIPSKPDHQYRGVERLRSDCHGLIVDQPRWPMLGAAVFVP